MIPTYLGVSEIYLKHKDRNNFVKQLHHEVCDKLKVEYSKVNTVSILYKVNLFRKEIEKLKKYSNKDKLNVYLNHIFDLLQLKQKPSNGNAYREQKADSSKEKEDKEDGNTRVKDIISEQSIVITHLRRENTGLKDQIIYFNAKYTNRKL